MMHETTGTGDNSPLSLLDSTNSRTSVSTDRWNANEQLLEGYRKKMRKLESENLALKRALPHLRDAKGDDCNDWAINLANELEDEKRKYTESQDKLAALAQNYRELRDSAEQSAQKSAKLIEELRHQALGLEEENGKLKNELRDDQSMIFHLRQQLNSDVGTRQEERSEEEQPLSGVVDEYLRQIEDRRSEGGTTAPSTERTPIVEDSERDVGMDTVTNVLFENLCSYADFCMKILNAFGDDANNANDDGHILDKIREMKENLQNLKTNLDKSMDKYRKQVRSGATSAESSFRSHVDRAGPPLQVCTKCKLVEKERDALRVQLNNEIGLKEDYILRERELERELRETRRHLEELRGDLRVSHEKVVEVEEKLHEMERDKQRLEESFRRKNATASRSTDDLNELVRTLRQRNLELDAKNEEILRAAHRYKEINSEELNDKEIEIFQEKKRIDDLEQQLDSEKINRELLEEELQKKEAVIQKYSSKFSTFRRILAQYEYFMDTSVEYETSVIKGNEILQEKINEGLRACSSASNNPALRAQPNGNGKQ